MEREREREREGGERKKVRRKEGERENPEFTLISFSRSLEIIPKISS